MRGIPAGVDEADKLDSEQAKHVLRRAGRMMRPYRGKLYLSVGLIALYTVCILAGPYLVRWAIDSSISPAAEALRDGRPVPDSAVRILNTAIVLYIVVAVSTTSGNVRPSSLSPGSVRASSATCASGCSPTSSASPCRSTTGRRRASSSAG